MREGEGVDHLGFCGGLGGLGLGWGGGLLKKSRSRMGRMMKRRVLRWGVSSYVSVVVGASISEAEEAET